MGAFINSVSCKWKNHRCIQMYYVYILTNKSNTTLYVGITNDIVRRMQEHKAGTLDGFTKRYQVNKLVYFEEFTNVDQAISREKQIKSWRREKKDELIKHQNSELKDYSLSLL